MASRVGSMLRVTSAFIVFRERFKRRVGSNRDEVTWGRGFLTQGDPVEKREALRRKKSV